MITVRIRFEKTGEAAYISLLDLQRVFPVNSPFVENVEVVRRGKVRRAKLFYLRSRTGKAAKVKARV